MAKWWKFILFNSSNLPPRRLDQSVTIDHVDLDGGGDSNFDNADDAQLSSGTFERSTVFNISIATSKYDHQRLLLFLCRNTVH